MPQYLILPQNIRGTVFTAGAEEANHILRAARARVGDEIEIFDGRGKRYLGVIKEAGQGSLTGEIREELPSPEYATRLTLCFAVTARQALEETLERCTAAGAAVFQPMLTSRVQFDIFSDWERRLPRYEQIALAACKQCGRGLLPEIRRPGKMDDLLAQGPAVFASQGGAAVQETAAALAGKKDIRLFVGPEGGFTKGELEFARGNGALFMGLGLHVLRAEDACFAASSALLERLG